MTSKKTSKKLFNIATILVIVSVILTIISLFFDEETDAYFWLDLISDFTFFIFFGIIFLFILDMIQIHIDNLPNDEEKV